MKKSCENKRKPKILIIGPLPPPTGGVQTVVKTLLKSFLSEKYHILHFDVTRNRGYKDAGRATLYNVHTKVRATTKREAERVGKYMIRPLLSLKRLSIDKNEGKVCYQYGKDSSELERTDYVEFIARVTSHIPDKGQVMVRYYGLYSNAHRGKIRKAEVDSSHPQIIEDETPFVPSRSWAEMIRKVYETDSLLCPRCGGQMRIISFIENPKVIDKIILHLKLTFQAERPPQPQVVQQELLTTAEEREGYF